MSTNVDQIRVLVFKNNDNYIAQCLEYDIAVQGQTLEELEERFVCTIMAYALSSLENDEAPFSQVPETPQEFWEKYGRARPFRDPLLLPPDLFEDIDNPEWKNLIPRQACLAIL